jgi:hypothetical protein
MCKEGIFVQKTQNSLSILQTSRIRFVSMGNEILAKPNMSYTNYHHTNHNLETCKNKKEKPTIVVVETIAQ